MKTILPAIAIAAFMTAGIANAGEGTPNTMFPGSQGTVESYNAQVYQGQDTQPQATRSASTEAEVDHVVEYDTSTTGRYSNN